MGEQLEKKSLALEIVEFKYTLPIVIGIFAILMTWIMVLYFRAKHERRAVIMTALSLFGSSVLVFNLLLVIYHELRESVHVKRSMILSMNDQVVTEIKYIFREMLHNKDTLGQLYDEIIEGRTHDLGSNGRPIVTYHESNFLFIVFQVMLNFYRNYEFNTKDKDTRHNYNSWRQFLLKLMSSAKVQQFYATNIHLFNDILFNKFISIYVLPYVDIHIPIEDLISQSYRDQYYKKREEWKKHQLDSEVSNIKQILKSDPNLVIKPINYEDF